MHATDFLREIERLKDERLGAMTAAGAESLEIGGTAGVQGVAEQVRLLQIALANEISVSELAAAWMPSTPEVDIKIALARQAGDEARHFQIVEDRLKGLGFDVASFTPPGPNPLFEYRCASTGTSSSRTRKRTSGWAPPCCRRTPRRPSCRRRRARRS